MNAESGTANHRYFRMTLKEGVELQNNAKIPTYGGYEQLPGNKPMGSKHQTTVDKIERK